MKDCRDYYEVVNLEKKIFRLGRNSYYAVERVDDEKELCACLYANERIIMYTFISDTPYFIRLIQALEKIICLTIPRRELLLKLERYEELAEMEKNEMKELRKNELIEETCAVKQKINGIPLIKFNLLKHDIERFINDGEDFDAKEMKERIQVIEKFLRSVICQVNY